MPFRKAVLRGKRPLPEAYPAEPQTLGDHIRKRRLDLGLLQRDVAERIGVTESSVWNWENQGLRPELRHVPAILGFLGYDPRPEPATLAERIVRFREGKGWARPRLAEALGVDASTLARWERGEREPRGQFAAQLIAIIGGEAAAPRERRRPAP